MSKPEIKSDIRIPENSEAEIPENVKFNYLKSNYFRTVHMDGAIGNITPGGYIHMAIYSERPAIPREMVYKMNPDGTLGEINEKETIKREGIIREMEVDVMMGIGTAKSVIKWLEEQVQKHESQFSIIQEGG